MAPETPTWRRDPTWRRGPHVAMLGSLAPCWALRHHVRVLVAMLGPGRHDPNMRAAPDCVSTDRSVLGCLPFRRKTKSAVAPLFERCDPTFPISNHSPRCPPHTLGVCTVRSQTPCSLLFREIKDNTIPPSNTHVHLAPLSKLTYFWHLSQNSRSSHYRL